MHFKGHIITKEIPTEDRIREILEPYSYENDEEKEFEWDWWQIGGRFGGEIKIHFDPSENEDNWYAFHKRNNKYFISRLLNEIESKDKTGLYDELDNLQYMGLNEKVLYVDGGYTKDIKNLDISDCYVIIDEDGYCMAREKWNGEDWITKEDFNQETEKLELKDKFITVIDFHN